MANPPTNPVTLISRTTHVFFSLSIGNLSNMAVVMVSKRANYTEKMQRQHSNQVPSQAENDSAEVPTWVSSPRVNSMKKKSVDHRGDTGKRVTTSGKTMKAKPAPAISMIQIMHSHSEKCTLQSSQRHEQKKTGRWVFIWVHRIAIVVYLYGTPVVTHSPWSTTSLTLLFISLAM